MDKLTCMKAFVEMVKEGVDLAVRIGQPEDSSLVARKLATAEMVVCASSEHLAQAGTPQHPSQLSEHVCILDANMKTRASRILWWFLAEYR